MPKRSATKQCGKHAAATRVAVCLWTSKSVLAVIIGNHNKILFV